MRVPAYLTISRHNVFYFRWPLPKDLHPQGAARYIRLSLDTRDPKEALRLAKFLEYHAMNLQHRLNASMDYSQLQRVLKDHFKTLLAERKKALQADGPLDALSVTSLQNTIGFLEQEIAANDSDYLGTEQLDDTLSRFIKLHGLDITEGSKAYKNLRADFRLPFLTYCREVLDFNTGLRDYELSDKTSRQENSSVSPVTAHSTITLKQAIEDFVAECMRGRWTESTLKTRRPQLDLLLEYLGEEFDPAHMTKPKATELKKILLHLPKGRNKNPKTRDLPLQEAMRVPGVARIASKTINDYLQAYGMFWGWAANHGYAPDNPFEGMAIHDKKNRREKRDEFTDKQVQTIRAALSEHTPEKCGKHFRYWGVLIAMYTGARLNEIAQLELSDIREEDGIWFFDFNDESEDGAQPEKRLKNENSKRRVPIHEELLALGLLERVADLKSKRQKRLFPDLEFQEGHGYGRNLGRWFNETLLPKLDMKTDKLSFHSFRHSVVTRLFNAAPNTGMVKAITGHSPQGVAEGVYLKAYTLENLKKVIDLLEYE